MSGPSSSSSETFRERLRSPDPSLISPLRISKRGSPLVARRSSSSYKHVRNNQLVSKSPFKSQIPTASRPASMLPAMPSPRMVSGEKRPRPISMQEQAENERPFAFKRERRQSKTFQGLMQAEPVTKSPFKRVLSRDEDLEEEEVPPVPRNPSPTRSSMVSKRMHGPRTVDPQTTVVKRERRKTVTFDERCDVLEFDRDEDEMQEDPFDSEEEQDEEEQQRSIELEANTSTESGSSYPDDSFHLADESITGIVDSLFNNPSNGHTPSPPPTSDPLTSDSNPSGEILTQEEASMPLAEDIGNRPSTPPQRPLEIDGEDGVPYGRSHHAERVAAAHQLPEPEALSYPFTSTDEIMGTPPRAAGPTSPGSAMPLGRSTHAERVREEHRVNETDVDVGMLPPSPSPAVKRIVHTFNRDSNPESLIPKFGVQFPSSDSQPSGSESDPFALSSVQDEPQISELSFTSALSGPSSPIAEQQPTFASTSNPNHSTDENFDPGNLSIGHSEVSINGLDALESEDEAEIDQKSQGLELGMEMGLGLGLGIMTGSATTSEGSYSSFESVATSSPLSTDNKNAPPPPARLTVSERMAAAVSSRGLPAIPGRTGSPAPARMSSPAPPFRTSSPVPGRAASPVARSYSPLQQHSGIPTRVSSPSIGSRSGSPSLAARVASPLAQSSSSDSLASQGSQLGRSGSRNRISREDVQKRLLTKRSMESPLSGPAISSQESDQTTDEVRDNSVLFEMSMDDDEDAQYGTTLSAARTRTTTATPSVMTNFSTETAVVQTAEKHVIVPMTQHGVIVKPVASRPSMPSRPCSESGTASPSLEGHRFDFGGSFGKGEPDAQLGDMRSALDRLMDDVASSTSSKGTLERRQDADEGVDADESMETDQEKEKEVVVEAAPMRRAATDSALLPGFGIPASRSASGSSYASSHTAREHTIKGREELILEKRREARRRDEEDGGFLSPRRQDSGGSSKSKDRAIRKPRRSQSAGDAEGLTGEPSRKVRPDGLLDSPLLGTDEDPLADSIDRELRKLKGNGKSKYHVREREGMIYASSDADRISHMDAAGDIDAGKAWRTVRRPSDMNEYSKQIKEYRAQEKPGKASGKVFVRVVGVRGLVTPIPHQTTAITCTLNNGIHFVTTPETRLGQDCRIDQEFELIEHGKLEFTLTLKIRRDPHIIAQFKAAAPQRPVAPPPPPTAPAPAPHRSGMRSFFSSSPKKASKALSPPPPPAAPAPPPKLPENLARYLKADGTLARAFISFKDIAHRCDTRLFETNYPLIGQKTELGSQMSTIQVGEIVLQVFRLPPLPNIPPEQLPQSLEQCHRGLRHINWHKVTYFEGTLTQNGGDCMSWRRRQLRVTGSNLIAFNDVTKKATATIDLKKALAVEDDDEARANAMSPASMVSARSSRYDDYDSGIERSFRLIFPGDQEIQFYADTDEEKSRWLEVLRALVGHIPPNPLWAELVYQRQEDLARRAAGTATPSSSKSPMLM